MKVQLTPTTTRFNFSKVLEDATLVDSIIARLRARCPHLEATEEPAMPASGAELCEPQDQMDYEGAESDEEG